MDIYFALDTFSIIGIAPDVLQPAEGDEYGKAVIDDNEDLAAELIESARSDFPYRGYAVEAEGIKLDGVIQTLAGAYQFYPNESDKPDPNWKGFRLDLKSNADYIRVATYNSVTAFWAEEVSALMWHTGTGHLDEIAQAWNSMVDAYNADNGGGSAFNQTQVDDLNVIAVSNNMWIVWIGPGDPSNIPVSLNSEGKF